jgi:hypothetical protein
MEEVTAVQKNIAARLKFRKEHLDVQNIMWTDETKVELFGRKEHTTLWVEKKRHSTLTSKPHPNYKVWWREHHCLVLLCCLNRKMNSQVYQDILQENVRLSVLPF